MNKSISGVLAIPVLFTAFIAASVLSCQDPSGQPQTYTIHYDANGSTSGSAPSDDASYTEGEQVIAMENTGGLARDHFTFSGWNTEPDGRGTSRACGSSFAMGGENLTLYARWTAMPTFTVSYSDNGSTSGSAPSDDASYAEGDQVIAMENTGGLARDHFTFSGWNTAPDGSGTSRACGSSFVMGGENLTLYARWTANPTFTVSYNANEGSAGTVPEDSTNYEENQTVTVRDNSGGLTMANHYFDGWNTIDDGSGTGYQPGDTFPMGSGDLILYAVWTPYHSVTYNGNENGWGEVPEDNGSYAPGDSIEVSANSGELLRHNHSFMGWNTQPDGSGISYRPGDMIEAGKTDITLFAEWREGNTSLRYQLIDGTDQMELHDGEGAYGDVFIPECIDGYYVVSIDDYAFNNNIHMTSITLPDSLSSIGDNAFYSCSILESVILPDALSSIGDYAFCNCDSLESVTLPDALSSIGDYAFYNCSSLESVTLPDALSSLGDYIFCNCDSLESVTLPDSLTSVGSHAFSNCVALTSVTLPDSLTSVGSSAFSSCDALTSVTLPDSLTSLGYSAFSGCKALTSVTLPDSLSSLEYSIFSYCAALTSVYLPESLTSIGSESFSYCTSLVAITFPASLETIGDHAFNYCSSLQSVISFPDNPPKMQFNTFYNCHSSLIIYVPEGSVDDYKNASYWSDYKEQIMEMPDE